MIKQMFTGRIGIAQYWLSVLLLIFLTIGLTLFIGILAALGITGLLVGLGGGAGMAIVGVVIATIIAVVLFLMLAVPAWGLAVRRYHDVGLSIWVFLALMLANWIISAIFPVAVGEGQATTLSLTNLLINLPISIVMLAILLWPGKKEDNKYGARTRYGSIWKAIRGVKPSASPEAPAA